MQHDLILGTAGHIDHGKTSLIEALTGTATDRLPEEKKRGITIELGYAFLDLDPWRIGVVDVPGHEKFVRQMLSGATGMDVAMLVVAGDDSVKQQTIEHLDILRMLNLPAGVIALTKCDLVEDDWLDMVEEEIRGRVAGSFLENATIVRCSSKTGQGIDELKAAIVACCETASLKLEAAESAPFRMAVDRSFTIEGHGTVVTGSVASGHIAVGDQLQLQPGNIDVRVRGIQNHDHSSETVQRGQRAAINLAGIHHQKIDRGHELTATGFLRPSSMVLVEIQLLSDLKRPLKDRSKVRFHIGTAEILANVRLMNGKTTETDNTIEPGGTGFAQLYLNEDAVAVYNQPFILRSESPVMTIGGGRVLHPNPVLLKRPDDIDLKHVAAMTSDDPATRASSSIYLAAGVEGAGGRQWDESDLPRIAGVESTSATVTSLIEEGELLQMKLTQSRNLEIHRDRLTQVANRIIAKLEALHDKFPLRFTHPRNVLENSFQYLDQPEVLAAAVELLKKEKKITANVSSIGLAGRGPKLSKGQKVLFASLIDQVKSSGLQGPTVKKLEQDAAKNKDSVAELLSMACENGDMVRLEPDGFYIHTETMSAVKKQLTEAIGSTDGLTISDIRQVLGVSRKYSVPLCEFLDKIEFTRRVGDKRLLFETA
jgi:selenocysteine-specific elongation factor